MTKLTRILAGTAGIAAVSVLGGCFLPPGEEPAELNILGEPLQIDLEDGIVDGATVPFVVRNDGGVPAAPHFATTNPAEEGNVLFFTVDAPDCQTVLAPGDTCEGEVVIHGTFTKFSTSGSVSVFAPFITGDTSAVRLNRIVED
jgi:hypothetical protein